jgi:hypothetical protein
MVRAEYGATIVGANYQLQTFLLILNTTQNLSLPVEYFTVHVYDSKR